MKILFNFELTTDDYQDLINDFDIVEHIQLEANYENAIVDTKDLVIDEFDDYIQKWLVAWYKLELSEDKYMITL